MLIHFKGIFPEISTVCLISSLIVVQSVGKGSNHVKALPSMVSNQKKKLCLVNKVDGK